MILYLDYSSGGIRGGEIYNTHLYKFLGGKFEVFPEKIPSYSHRFRNPVTQSLYHLKLVKQMKPDMIVFDISSGIRNILALRWMKKNKRKSLLIIQEERQNFRWNNFVVRWLIRYIEKYLVRHQDIFVVNSEFSAGLAGKKGAPAGAPIIIAHPGMENIKGREETGAVLSEVSSEIFELLYVGVCKKHKGIYYLIEAMNMLKSHNIKLNIVGQYSAESRYFRKIERFIERNNIQKAVEFHGFVDRETLVALFNRCDLYVHPSLMEGYGMVLAEAMNFGLPIIATTAGAIPELVKDGVNGVLVRPKDSESIAAAISKLYENKELRRNYSLNNLKRSKNLPTWRDFANRLEQDLIPAIEQAAGIKAAINNKTRDHDK